MKNVIGTGSALDRLKRIIPASVQPKFSTADEWRAWQARASLCGNSALNVPPERPADSSNGDDIEAWFDEGWNACRSAMLNGGKS
ncbi:hypothetical protein H3Y94_003038 [Salmonella enterica]|nr:hypothetical protein [Salmonella enterica]EFW6102585.1 hypothetical protein [Salmonella enterica]EGB0592640.1 hypothetical protein [Salmonella enterica]EGB2314236.1 hypothetical protein [Salmonella enterica]